MKRPILPYPRKPICLVCKKKERIRESITVMVSECEKRYIMEEISKTGKSVSNYFRQILLDMADFEKAEREGYAYEVRD